jgi:CRP-like cAMP-binding protein
MAELPEVSMAALKRIGTLRRYRDGQYVQQRGDSADHAVVVMSGRLRSVAYTADGTEQLMRWMEPGEITGLSSVLGNVPVPIDLVAAGPTELLALPRQPFLAYLETDARTCLALARLLSLRVNELHDVIFTRTGDTLAARVWATLQRLAKANGEPLGNGRTSLQISQHDLARAVGASRQRVNEELRQLQIAEKVRLGYRRIEIVDLL